MRRVLLTGGSGFVGGALLSSLSDVVVVGRTAPCGFEGEFFKRGLSSAECYEDCLKGIDTVVHCAARVHVMNEETRNPLEAFRDVNVGGTLALALQAADKGVRRFIFISSIKVNGEGGYNSLKYTSLDQPAPEDPYALSKYEAEQELIKVSKETSMELVIIRPTLVYGAGVKGNFLNLLRLSKLSLPLPFGSILNVRSMIYSENLVNLILTCVDHPNAANQTFLVSDGEDLSLKSLITYIRKAMGKSPLLLPVPVGLFKLAGKLTGKSGVVDRLVGDLQVDSSKARELLDWTPPYTVEQGIAATVSDFINRKD